MELAQLPSLIDRLELMIATLEGSQSHQGLLASLTDINEAIKAEAGGLSTIASGISAMTASRIEDMDNRIQNMEKAIVSMESATRGLIVLKDPDTWVRGTKTALVAQFESDKEFANSFSNMAERAFSDAAKERLEGELKEVFDLAIKDFKNNVVDKAFENAGEYRKTKNENESLKSKIETYKERVVFLQDQLSRVNKLSSGDSINYSHVIISFIIGVALTYGFLKGAI